ncbi:class D sortase [Candidatus Dojkabacteria bacterium]|nr:class D sortase [Candidatus Dojkabacteria bacterium]
MSPSKKNRSDSAESHKACSGKKEKKSKKSKKSNVFAKVSLAVFSIMGVVVLIMPFMPNIIFWLRDLMGNVEYDPQEVRARIQGEGGRGDSEDGFQNTRILIPEIGLNAPVVEGEDESVMDQGAWHRPGTGNPIDGGNTVITGHRFRYLPPNNLTFYHLDKVEKGDEVILFWDGVEFDYIVTETFVVDPDRTDIEGNTVEPKLTLYTCTPLWTAQKRLVVIAEPVNDEGDLEEIEIDGV